jgi:TPR repeat protein
VQRDLAEAARAFTLSAGKGNVFAQYYLGLMYLHGEVSERAAKDEITMEEKENAYYYLSYD